MCGIINVLLTDTSSARDRARIVRGTLNSLARADCSIPDDVEQNIACKVYAKIQFCL